MYTLDAIGAVDQFLVHSVYLFFVYTVTNYKDDVVV
jgi:hypothetical protein